MTALRSEAAGDGLYRSSVVSALAGLAADPMASGGQGVPSSATSTDEAQLRSPRLLTVGYRVALAGAGVAVLGGIADVLVPRLLPHHEQLLGVAPGAAPPATAQLVLLLLHALGAALAALGLATLALLVLWRRSASRWTAWAAAGPIALGETANAAAIYHAGSALFIGPLVCVAAVIFGVAVGEYARNRGTGAPSASPIRSGAASS